MLTRTLVCSYGSVSACLNVVGPLSVAVVINQNLEHGGLQNLLNDLQKVISRLCAASVGFAVVSKFLDHNTALSISLGHQFASDHGWRLAHDWRLALDWRLAVDWRLAFLGGPSSTTGGEVLGLAGKPQRSHVISFPRISDTENGSENDGIEYDFRFRYEYIKRIHCNCTAAFDIALVHVRVSARQTYSNTPDSNAKALNSTLDRLLGQI